MGLEVYIKSALHLTNYSKEVISEGQGTKREGGQEFRNMG